MTDVKIRKGDWLVVADGANAIILENAGTVAAPKLKARATYQQENPPTRELGTDAPGRSINSVDGRRSAMEQTDWHAQAEERFLTDLAGRLDAAVAAGQAKSLVLAAPPRALGIIRRVSSPALRRALRAEVEKDFVRKPLHEIERHFAWPM